MAEYNPRDNDNDGGVDEFDDGVVTLDVDSVIRETDSAWLLDLGDGDEHWIPKSIGDLILQIPKTASLRVTEPPKLAGKVTVPERFAVKEGLV